MCAQDDRTNKGWWSTQRLAKVSHHHQPVKPEWKDTSPKAWWGVELWTRRRPEMTCGCGGTQPLPGLWWGWPRDKAIKGGVNTLTSLVFHLHVSCFATKWLNRQEAGEGGGWRGCLVVSLCRSASGTRECTCMRRWDVGRKQLAQKPFISLVQKWK